MQNYAPILLFVYNRPEETLRTLEALKNNHIAKYSDLYIYSDFAKKEKDKSRVEVVRGIIERVEGFRSITVYKQQENKGLANSIISGVSEVISKFKKVIVLEDDLVTSPGFLNYMNDALNFYEDNDKIWSISGFNPIQSIPKDYLGDIYLTGRGCSWGWATWLDRWKTIDWDIGNYNSFKKSRKLRGNFNKYGNDLSLMLEDQVKGFIDSWAIRWCFNQFLQEKYTVYPRTSLVKNIGFENNSTHGSLRYSNEEFNLNIKDDFIFESKIDINNELIKTFAQFYNLKFYNYIGYLLKRLGLYRMVKRYIRLFLNRKGGKV